MQGLPQPSLQDKEWKYEWVDVGEYDCSICGCSNRLNKKIEVESPEMKNHVYEFRAKNLT